MPAKVSIKTPEDSLIQLFKAVHSIAWVRKLVNRKEKKEKKNRIALLAVDFMAMKSHNTCDSAKVLVRSMHTH